MKDTLLEHQRLFAKLEPLIGAVEAAQFMIYEALQDGGKVLLCGNGGSAADCQHFAAELTGRYSRERQPLPAIALTTDTSALTAIANDYGFDQVFSRQVRALGARKDVLVAISTSGASVNVLNAISAAVDLGMGIVFLTGQVKPTHSWNCLHIAVPSPDTARVQEVHGFILHCWAEALDGLAKT